MDEFEKTDSAPIERQDDFELLAIRYLDGLTTADEACDLSAQLASSAENRNQFAALCVQIGLLGEMAIAADSSNPRLGRAFDSGAGQQPTANPALLPSLCDAANDEASLQLPTTFTLSSVGQAFRGGQKWLFRSSRRVAAASIAIALLGVGIWWMTRDKAAHLSAQREPQLIASLTHGSEAKWRDGLSLPDGAQFREGQILELAEGQAQISMSCGAEVVMRAPCSIVLTTPNQLALHEGLLCVQLAEWTSGFTVATEAVQILDLGKQFIVSADAKSGAVEAHAINGKLRVQTKNAPVDKYYGLLVTEGEAIRIQPANNTSMRLKADEQLFNASLEDSWPYKPIQIHNTGRGLKPGDEDPNWRIISSSADDFGGPRYAVACDPYLNMYLPNEPDVSQWISISNPIDENCPPDTMYTFETEFDLTDYDLSTVTIAAHVLADNGVMGVRINGHYVPFKQWSAVYGLFDTYRKVEITRGFEQGVNKIQFDVWNSIVMSYPDRDNPMALRVEWQAFGRLKQQTVRRASDVDDVSARRHILTVDSDRPPLRQLLTAPATRRPGVVFISFAG